MTVLVIYEWNTYIKDTNHYFANKEKSSSEFRHYSAVYLLLVLNIYINITTMATE